MFAWMSHVAARNHLRVESAKYARMIFTEVSMFDGLSAIPHLNPLPLANGEVGIGSSYATKGRWRLMPFPLLCERGQD